MVTTMYRRFWLADVVDALCGSWLFISYASHNVKRIPVQSVYRQQPHKWFLWLALTQSAVFLC